MVVPLASKITVDIEIIKCITAEIFDVTVIIHHNNDTFTTYSDHQTVELKRIKNKRSSVPLRADLTKNVKLSLLLCNQSVSQ